MTTFLSLDILSMLKVLMPSSLMRPVPCSCLSNTHITWATSASDALMASIVVRIEPPVEMVSSYIAALSPGRRWPSICFPMPCAFGSDRTKKPRMGIEAACAANMTLPMMGTAPTAGPPNTWMLWVDRRSSITVEMMWTLSGSVDSSRPSK